MKDDSNNNLIAAKWRKIKKKDIHDLKKILFENENDYVSACARFNTNEKTGDLTWVLCEKNGNILSLVINSKSTLLPVLLKNDVPKLDFLKGILRIKKVYSIQGLKNEVIVMENAMKQYNQRASDIIDYELMSLDKPPFNAGFTAGPSNLVLRVPQMTDIDVMAPLQAAYEQEEVIPKGSTFSPAASRINTAKIITSGQVLAAELNGRLVGKINVSSVSFNRVQIGGVFVHPDFRGKGIAGRMTTEFVSALINQGKGVTLFVKKNNNAAKSLYINMGFIFRDDYRITYY